MRRQAHLWLIPLIASALAYSFSARARRDLADLVLRAASERSSVTHARSRCRRGTSNRHARRLLAYLDLGRTQRALTRALRQLAAPHVPGHPVDVAIDFHDVPYYGEPIDPQHPQFVKTQESRGTHRAYHYASLDLLFSHFRLTVSVRFLAERGNRHRAVLRALADARRCGVRVRRLYLDRELYTYDVLSWLSGQGRTVIVPLRLGSHQRKKWEHGKKSYVTEHVLKHSKGKGAPLPLRIHVLVRHQKGKKFGKHGCQYLIYAVLGHLSLDARHSVPLRRTHDLYRRRFGIESSYRVAHLGLPRTCARSVAWRLLYLGVALMLENEWTILRLLYTREGRQGPTGLTLREELLRFEDLLDLLFSAVSRVLGTVREIGNPKPPPRRLKRWGMALPRLQGPSREVVGVLDSRYSQRPAKVKTLLGCLQCERRGGRTRSDRALASHGRRGRRYSPSCWSAYSLSTES